MNTNHNHLVEQEKEKQKDYNIASMIRDYYIMKGRDL